MTIEGPQLKEVLLRQNYVTEEDLKKAEDYSVSHRVPITEYLVSEGLVTNDLIGGAFAEFYGIPYADLNSYIPSREQVAMIPEEIGVEHRVVLFQDGEKSVTIATDEPKKEGLMEILTQALPGKKIKIAFSLPEDIDAVLMLYRKTLETRFAQIIKEQKRVAPEIIEEIFKDAISYRASDIHFEPQEKEVLVRFRVDGVLQEAGRIPKDYYENILNRIKVQSRLRIDEHFSAQDGSLRFTSDSGYVDMRISVAPVLEGEKIVIRLLGQYVRSFTMGDIGLSGRDQQIIEAAVQKPFGMILVAGPTGSGKTTTLYALVKILNQPDVNVTTIEDPVEIRVLGTNQIQVNTQTNLTFAKGLRSIVRQDPDVILVGEIRDVETAEISVNAALTGHLLLSTFHANDAATAIPRLLEMGIEPFLLSSTLEMVVAQRLVRKICESCRHSVVRTQAELKTVFADAPTHFTQKKMTLYEGRGCEFCNHTGYKGRAALFEIIQVTQRIRDAIMKSPTSQAIWAIAVKEGSQTLFDDGILKVKNGVTTLDELLRVASPANTKERYGA